MQIETQVFPFFHIPEWVVRWVVIAAVIGFPFAMLDERFYELYRGNGHEERAC